uniref:Uncharacterized protein n=1 Tax=Rhizophora mucronata TaxID=61149 RepID=A0A2P2PNP4_RHIMU
MLEQFLIAMNLCIICLILTRISLFCCRRSPKAFRPIIEQITLGKIAHA